MKTQTGGTIQTSQPVKHYVKEILHVKFNFIKFDLNSAFNKGHCCKAPLQNQNKIREMRMEWVRKYSGKKMTRSPADPASPPSHKETKGLQSPPKVHSKE